VVTAGQRLEVAGLAVHVLDLAGHHPEAVGYLFKEGFDVPIIAVGDAVFARSAGGCPGPSAYRKARATIIQALAPLPDETLLLTGHGAPATLGVERTENPFLAAWLGRT
jgi:glyoxylase-like metal-dependent hydrolase (beta-lactamase superfamily II)